MTLFATICSDTEEIKLPEKSVMSYFIACDTAGYAKSYLKYMKLHLEIDVRAILSNGFATPEENEEMLNSLREWGKMRYTGPDCSYYRTVTMTHLFGEDVFREIELSHAYVENFIETLELVKRLHVLEFELLQKEGRLKYVNLSLAS